MCALKLLQKNNISSWIALLWLLSTASSHFHFSDDRSLLEVPVGEWVHGSCGPEVNESHFFNFETRMRISPIQSPTLRRDENFFDSWSQASRRDREKFFFNLGHRDEIEIYYFHSQASRQEREFLLSDLSFRYENGSSKLLTFPEVSDLKGFTNVHANPGTPTVRCGVRSDAQLSCTETRFQKCC